MNTDDYIDNMPDLDISNNTSHEENKKELMPEIPLHIKGIDPRIQLLSNSSRSTLNKCPRKFQLYRLSSEIADLDKGEEAKLINDYQQLTFDYGTVVGLGIQGILIGKSVDEILLEAFLYWSVDITLRNPRQNKSFWEACLAIQQFRSLLDNEYLGDYELVHYQGKPAVELSFQINLPNGFKYRGYIDAVLKHKLTGAVIVLEAKTTSIRNVNPSQYKNSGQALGYSVILDMIFPGMSSYTVLYLVYSTPLKEYVELPFEKSAMQRALWITDLVIDTKKIELYESFGSYPMNGDFCYDFYRDCEYLGLCTLSTERLTKVLTQQILDKIEEREVYDFTFKLEDLISSQENKD